MWLNFNGKFDVELETKEWRSGNLIRQEHCNLTCTK